MKPDHNESILEYQESGAFNEQNVLKSQRFTYNSHCIGGQQFLRRHGGEICNVCERVHNCHQWNGDVYGSWQISEKKKKKT